MDTYLDFSIAVQPDETTCGPTCLHSVYRFYGDSVSLQDVIKETHALKGGGTLSVFLANHALRRGYRAKMITYNLQIFDPTWIALPREALREKLLAQAEVKTSRRILAATKGYLEFLELGGTFMMEDLRPGLIRRYLKRNVPILTGLSSTYLYRTPREYGPNDDYDDVRGEPQGHFVVLCGYQRERREVLVADPMSPNPAFENQIYTIPIERVITSILLGIVTHDANLLLIEKPRRTSAVRVAAELQAKR